MSLTFGRIENGTIDGVGEKLDILAIGQRCSNFYLLQEIEETVAKVKRSQQN